MKFWRERALLLACVLILIRFLSGAMLPLSADEAYYWLWSQHLAAGYYDHPPAIAFVIRVGTLLFGDTEFGVRVGGLLLSVAATFVVLRSGAILFRDSGAGALAALLFNATLMIAVETMAATPDAPLIACAAGFVFCLVKVADTGKGAWWLAAGVAAGLGLLSKYAMLFLGAGALLWLVADARARRWLLSPYPYAGGLIAGLLFAPNILWNANHDWMTFAFQFGRIGVKSFSWKYPFEFIGAELLLATPFVFVLGVIGIVRARKENVLLPAALCWPSIVYFFWHSLHDRVQGNWPCFLLPAFVLLAVAAMRMVAPDRLTRIARAGALPTALVLLAAAYLQAGWTIAPLRGDPLARLLAVGMTDVADMVRTIKSANRAAALATTDYATTGWLRFYMPGEKVVMFGESFRWPDADVPERALLQQPLLYVVEDRRDLNQTLLGDFARVQPLSEFPRVTANGEEAGRYRLYVLGDWKGKPIGRLP